MCIYVVNEKFAQWATSLNSTEGGNPKAAIWFFGIEPGGDGPPELRAPDAFFQDEFGMNIPYRPQGYIGYLEHSQLDKKIARVLWHLYGEEVDSPNWHHYMVNYLYTQNGHSFKLNLYPLSANHIGEQYWTIDHFNLTGLPTKILYRAWCALHRFPFLHGIAEEFAPKVIVCIGKIFRSDFMIAFAAPEDIYANHHKIQLDGNLSLEDVPIFGGRSHLLIIPFLRGGNGGINANAQLSQLATRIRAFL